MSGIQEHVHVRAYELWQRACSPEDRSEEFWFAAERELENSTATADEEAGILDPSVKEPPVAAFYPGAPAGW